MKLYHEPIFVLSVIITISKDYKSVPLILSLCILTHSPRHLHTGNARISYACLAYYDCIPAGDRRVRQRGPGRQSGHDLESGGHHSRASSHLEAGVQCTYLLIGFMFKGEYWLAYFYRNCATLSWRWWRPCARWPGTSKRPGPWCSTTFTTSYSRKWTNQNRSVRLSPEKQEHTHFNIIIALITLRGCLNLVTYVSNCCGLIKTNINICYLF